MTTDVEFAVVGAGVAGAATARFLAQAGRETVLLEQFHVGHTRGSSHGASRIFRLSYDDATYVRMAIDSLALWRELERESNRDLILTTGGIDAGKDLDAHVAALRDCGAAYELLTGAQVRERFPAIALPENEPALFQPDAGIARAEDAVEALVAGALGHGAELREDTLVTGLRDTGGSVEIQTPDEPLRARVAVVAAGGWAPTLLATAGIALDVVPTRETVAYFSLDQDLTVPSLVEWQEPAFYSLTDPGRGVKAGLHHAGPVTDPSQEGEVSEETVARLRERVAALYPAADPSPRRAETCIYTNTSDETFVLERHGRIVVGSACSGHGFKFAPLTGRRLASLALDGSG